MDPKIAAALLLLVPRLAYADDSMMLTQTTVGSTNQTDDYFGRALAVGTSMETASRISRSACRTTIKTA